ncbi:PAS domain S-box protein, partial [candidate division WOR-3 bacterium]|nr:PAS domain S-box protein [candidate division WOR-3 bacterium]
VLVEGKTADLSGVEALRESHERFLTVLDSLDSGVYVADMKTYEILFANQKMRNYFGNIEGKTCWQVLQHGQSGPCDFCTNDKLLDVEGEPTGVYAWEFQNTINGFWCEIRDRAIRWVDGRMVRLEIAMDVTKRKQATEALRESESRFRAIFERAGIGMALMDMDENLLQTNHALQEMLGYSAEELQGMTLDQITHPDDIKRELDLIKGRRIDKREDRYQTEKRYIRKDGQIIWGFLTATTVRDPSGGGLYGLGMVEDITERRRAEQTLERERKAFRTIAEAAANATDIPDLCQRVIEGFVDIMGFDFGAVRLYDEGKRILEAVAVTDMNEAKARSKPSPRSIDNLTHIPSIVARTRQAIFAPDVRGHEILKTHKQRLEELGIRSLITWPILGTGDRLLGVMHLVAGTPKEIPESHRVFFQTVAEMFATVLERKRAEQGINRHSRELSTLLEVSTEVSATLDEEEVTRLIAKRATELIGADGCTIYRFDPQTEELVPKTTTVLQDREQRLAYHISLGEGITGKAALERQPILANNVHLDDSAIRIPGVEETPRCLLVAPLVAHGELWGVMTLVR